MIYIFKTNIRVELKTNLADSSNMSDIFLFSMNKTNLSHTLLAYIFNNTIAFSDKDAICEYRSSKRTDLTIIIKNVYLCTTDKKYTQYDENVNIDIRNEEIIFFSDIGYFTVTDIVNVDYDLGSFLLIEYKYDNKRWIQDINGSIREITYEKVIDKFPEFKSIIDKENK